MFRNEPHSARKIPIGLYAIIGAYRARLERLMEGLGKAVQAGRGVCVGSVRTGRNTNANRASL